MHAKDLKYSTGYRRQWENRNVKGCRCNCPEEYSPEEADAARKAFEAKRGRFKTMEELDAWREREKAKQRAQNQREKERLEAAGREGFGWRARAASAAGARSGGAGRRKAGRRKRAPEDL